MDKNCFYGSFRMCLFAILAASGLAACAQKGGTIAVSQTSLGGPADGGSPPSPQPGKQLGPTAPPVPGAMTPPVLGTSAKKFVILDQATEIEVLNSGVLESKTKIPAGSQLAIPENFVVRLLPERQNDGSESTPSTGFIDGVALISVPLSAQALFPTEKIISINESVGGLFVSAVIQGPIQGTTGVFTPLSAASAGTGFLAHYESNGRPKFNYLSSVMKRFGSRLNKGIDPSQLSAADQIKWSAIYSELKRVGDRTVPSMKSLLMIPIASAQKESVDYEKTGAIPLNGAWTVAVQATAVRHGFANTPCAEFMSEVVREAYERAGYRVSDDFYSGRGNELIWSNSAAVVNFSEDLYIAGWVPWDSLKYRPPAGALMMNGAGETPGHTYMSAGDDGRFLIDNGSPQGRDLRITSSSIIAMMYEAGVFFLPPGVNPKPW